MANEEQNAPDITEESTDQLGAPDSQEEQDDWSPDDLNEEQSAQYDRGVAAVDDFIATNPRYRQTEGNRELILGYFADHDLPLSPASLALAYEQLEDRLDLEPEQRDSEAVAKEPDEQPDEQNASTRLATALLARGTKSEDEPPESAENEPEMPEKEIGRRGKPVAWRNGRAVIGVGS